MEIPLAIMLGCGAAFLVWMLALLFSQGLPSANTATLTSRNKMVSLTVAPVFTILAVASVAAGFYYSTSAETKLYPLLLVPMLSLLLSVLAMYFSLFQITVVVKP